mmetsp:Transcript_138215/g.251580  ORF Transcript_138215/g.251580 Transcript_138215/m.251580 type:complete len:319 (-) Transcript_138215:104-1060(-)
MRRLTHGQMILSSTNPSFSCMKTSRPCWQMTIHFSVTQCSSPQGSTSLVRILQQSIALRPAWATHWLSGIMSTSTMMSSQVPSSKPPKKPKKATESKISKEALKEATKGKHSTIIPAAGRADHPAAVLPKAPQQIVLWGNAMTDGSVTAWGTDFSVLLNAMSQAGARIPILVMTRGSYGRFMGESVAANWNNASSMSMWGLVRTARQEIPNIPMLLVEVPYGTPLAEIPRCLTPSDSEQCYYHGVKFLPQIEQVPSLAKKAEQTPGLGAAKTGGAKPMFTRKMFNWGRPEGKLDNVWFRQKWVSMGPAWGEMPMRKTA